jgi:hypothetical protein
MEAEIFIASINCRLKLADIYDRVIFPPQKTPLVAVSKEAVRSGKKQKRGRAR